MSIIKTKKEIRHIEKACKITDEIFTTLIKHFKNFKTEIEIRDFLLQEIKKRKLRPSFLPIVTSGKRAGNEIHPQATNNKVKGFTIIDFGVRYSGYCSDMTRTIYVGIPNKEERTLYKKIGTAQLLGLRHVTAEKKCFIADQEVRLFLGTHKKYFIHTLGHGVGKKIHESPRIYEKQVKPSFKKDMVVTVEPGIYIKNKLGIRIEDTCVVTETKPLVLTKSTKDFIVVK